MKKLLILPILGLMVAVFAPTAQADPTDTIAHECVGRAGVASWDGNWHFQSHMPVPGTPLGLWTCRAVNTGDLQHQSVSLVDLRVTAGTLACGSGDVTGDGRVGGFDEVAWQGTFTGGVGTITGTAVRTATGETRALTGQIVVPGASACDEAQPSNLPNAAGSFALE